MGFSLQDDFMISLPSVDHQRSFRESQASASQPQVKIVASTESAAKVQQPEVPSTSGHRSTGSGSGSGSGSGLPYVRLIVELPLPVKRGLGAFNAGGPGSG